MKQAITLVNLFRSDRQGERLLPLGCLAVRAALEAAGHLVQLRDLQFLSHEQFHDPDFLAPLLDDSDSICGLSLMVDALPLAVALGRRLKERRPDRLLVLGGPGPTAVASLLVRAFPWIDYVVRGEGEETLPELLAALTTDQPERVAGVAAAATSRRSAFATPERPLQEELDRWPLPRIDDLPLDEYSYYTTVASRGCPYRCTFCEIRTRQRGRLRRRSIPRLVSELQAVQARHGMRFVAFQDDHLLHDRAWLDQLLTALAQAGVQLSWAGFGRADQVDSPWLASLRDRGLQHVTFGIEAGTDRQLRSLRKGFTLQRALRGVAAATAELPTTCFFMWGYPDEELEDFFGTALAIHQAEYLGAEVQVGQVVPLAGSELYEQYADRVEYHESYPFCRLLRLPAHPELRALIREHPVIFSAFHAFRTPQQELKWPLAQELCCRG